MDKNYALITRYIRNLRGGSQPILAQASDKLFYVVKFANNLQGSNLLFNESMGGELYRACGLARPAWKPLVVTDAFIDQNQDCWMQTPEGRLRPSSGLCFGSHYLGGDSNCLGEIMPGTSFRRVRNHMDFWLAWLIDICACHADNRQAIFLEDGAGWINAFFVDYGHFFGGPKGELKPHFLTSRYLDPRIYQSISSGQHLDFQKVVQRLDVENLWRQAQTLPEDWKTKSALNGFTQSLCRLSTSNLLKNILDTMMDAIQHVRESENGKQQGRRKRSESVLYPGVQPAGLECLYTAECNCRYACAQK